MTANLVKKIQTFAHNNDLWRKGAKIVVAVSGGPDSSCLLDVLVKLKAKYDFSLQIAHVNYGLRGKNSDKDEELVREKAKRYDLPISVLRLSKIEKKGNLEAQLRDIRYEFFETVRNELDFSAVAVGHTLNDQAETVLMRIIRGAGLQGLSAMQAKNKAVIRPLLETGREEVEEYLKENKIKFRLDATNKELSFTRNKIRHKLLPHLKQNYNPSILNVLANMAEESGEDYNYILAETRKKTGFLKESDEKIEWSLEKFSQLPLSLQKMCLRQSIERLSSLRDVESANIKEISKVLKSIKSKRQVVLFKGLKLERRGDRITLALNNQ